MKKLILILLLIFILGCEVSDKELTPQECEEIGGRIQNIVGGERCRKGEEEYGKVIGFISPNICCINIKGEEFCGRSTNHECSIKADCKSGGCSNHVCGGKDEEIITTCEWKECYDAKAYNVECKCIDSKCQWS